MTEKDQIHTLLADLAGQDPPVDIDLDRQIHRGQARVRRRTVSLCVAAVAVTAVAVGGIVTFRPDTNGSNAPAAGRTTPAPAIPTWATTNLRSLPHTTPDLIPTDRSRALLAQVKSVVPEFADLPEAKFLNFEVGTGADASLNTSAIWTYPGDNEVSITVDVGPRDSAAPVCEGTTGINACTEIRQLPDGSTAYLLSSLSPTKSDNGHAYLVRLDRPDGISVNVSSAAMKPIGTEHDAKLSLARVLEIAQKITVKPGN
jgi:hypothetical protein